MVELSAAQFEELVDQAIDQVPPELAARVDNCVVLVAEAHPDEPSLLGLYQGIPLTERDGGYAGVLPDTITIYRLPILATCQDAEQVRQEVLTTVVHEIGHFFGIDDQRLHELGWG